MRAIAKRAPSRPSEGTARASGSDLGRDLDPREAGLEVVHLDGRGSQQLGLPPELVEDLRARFAVDVDGAQVEQLGERREGLSRDVHVSLHRCRVRMDLHDRHPPRRR